MKTINYRGYTIEKQLTGWFTVFTSRYGYLKSDTLAGIKQMINHAIKAHSGKSTPTIKNKQNEKSNDN